MEPITIKIYLPKGNASYLRTAEISNWSGKALASSRKELTDLCAREEMQNPGVYLLVGSDPVTGEPMAYIGEAETLSKRVAHHGKKDFWVQVIVVVSKDENLTKAHTRYLEGKMIAVAEDAGRAKLDNSQASGAKLPESDQAEMDVFLSRILQLMPILGTNIFTPAASEDVKAEDRLVCRIKGLVALGQRTANGFVVFSGSEAVPDERPSAIERLIEQRRSLIEKGILARYDEKLVFREDYEFTSPSAAGAIIRGGSTNGLTSWRTQDGRTLEQLEAQK